MHGTDSPLDFANLPMEATASRGMDEGDDWLSTNWSFPEEGFDLEDAILRLIQKAIDQANGNVTAAARILGVPRDYVRYRLAKAEGSD
ncbi:MAG: helix-turn-helix domain-containing protein [Opitutales bacterium]